MRTDADQRGGVAPDPVLSPHEVAAELGVTYPTVLAYLKSGELRGVQRGVRWFIRRSALDAFLDPDHAVA